MKIESINKFINHCNKVKELGISYSDYEVLHVYKGYFSATFNKIKNSELEDSIIAKASAAYESNKRRKQSLDSNSKTAMKKVKLRIILIRFIRRILIL